MNKLYTIGHSTHTFDLFINILKNNQIDVVVDVRSIPYSQFADQYNKDNLKLFLKKNGIYYISMGNLLGARYEDKSLLTDDGKVDFEKVVETKLFQEGICRVTDGIRKGYNITLMCSEKNPLECHRFSLISRFLDEQGFDINHILPDKIIEHKILYDKLFNYFRLKSKISLEIEKILNLNAIQEFLFNDISKKDMYLALNKLVAYSPYT
ncbi:DUF488 [Desulfonema limicola]|uniref:DUF488 n=1 Tax=Desulfonema limicola TaxID=45656 RepID=A0A975BE42_9BACT|nr:DUF488 domain-containing protein [Desulfonema limicola]QTA83676.1 DUF488 [Desulfonema limicola]